MAPRLSISYPSRDNGWVSASLHKAVSNMCDGNLFHEIPHWLPFIDHAWDDFSDVPTSGGVYVVRVSRVGDTDLGDMVRNYRHSPLIDALSQLKSASGQLFKATGLADSYDWGRFNDTFGSDIAEGRTNRIMRIPMTGEVLNCPILYIGSSKALRWRLDQMAFGGHTANHCIWPLLMGGWQLEFGYSVGSAPGSMEDTFKFKYGETHDAPLPPFCDK